jgi:hypothetical protein
MMRFILLMAAMFALPFILWHVWRLTKAVPAEGDVDAPAAPNGLLALAGAGLALIVVGILAVTGVDEAARNGAYEPPRLVDGQVRPGSHVPAEDDVPDDDPPQR